MKVVVTINGLVTSDIVVHYALRYAAIFNHPLTLLHVNNPSDSRDDVEKSMTLAEETARGCGISCQRIFLQGEPAEAIQFYLLESKAEILFCTAGLHRDFLANSLCEKLARLPLTADLAVVRISHVDAVFRTSSIVLPIRKDRLSVEKFVFFSAMARAFQASTEIYSIIPASRRQLAALDLGASRALFQKINDRLNHYAKILHLLTIPLRIKHALARNEVDQILHHLAHHNFQLMIIGGDRLSGFPLFFGETPIERLFRHTPVNTIAFYKRTREHTGRK